MWVKICKEHLLKPKMIHKFIISLTTLFLLLTTLSCTHNPVQEKIIINELMQSNVDLLMVDHDFPDSWVELYNGNKKSITIGQYRIGTTNVFSEAVPLSSKKTTIEPEQHLILYCDKTTDNPFHYNFNLEASSGELFLFDETGRIVDSIYYPKMPAPNVAYGRVTDGGDEWQYELVPSPGEPNGGNGSFDVLPEPLFSVEGHLMTNGPEAIDISMPEGVPEDTRIYLTTDGSEPTWKSDNDTHFTINVDASMVVRAKLLSSQMLPSRSTTHSYIFHPRQTILPIVCITTDDAFLYSSEEGILSDDSADGAPIYSYDWRRPANFEYFNTQEGTTVFNQCGEMALGGNYSRKMPQKSIKCYAKKRFGKKNFKGNFWRDKPEVTKVKSFMLRDGGNNCLGARIEDAALQKFFGTNIDEIDWQAYEPVIVYINGIYKGIYEFRERSNEDFVTSNYGIDDDEMEMASCLSFITPEPEPCFADFYNLYQREDVTYEEIAEAMNIENFINILIAECYSSNTDFPKNNVTMWRQIGERNQWQWILKDLDFVSYYKATWNMFKYVLGTKDTKEISLSKLLYEKTRRKLKKWFGTNNIEAKDEEIELIELSRDKNVVSSTVLYKKMMSFPEFRDRFLATYATYLGDFLRPEVCLPIVNEMDKEIVNEIGPTFAAYNNMSTLNEHNRHLNNFRNYITERPAIVYQQMADYFSLGDVIPVSIFSEEDKDSIYVSNTLLRTGRFSGAWFTNFPLSLYVKGDDVSWVMKVSHKDGTSNSYTYKTSAIRPNIKGFCKSGDSVTFYCKRCGTLTPKRK